MSKTDELMEYFCNTHQMHEIKAEQLPALMNGCKILCLDMDGNGEDIPAALRDIIGQGGFRFLIQDERQRVCMVDFDTMPFDNDLMPYEIRVYDWIDVKSVRQYL